MRDVMREKMRDVMRDPFPTLRTAMGRDNPWQALAGDVHCVAVPVAAGRR
jgi:hypothetical protein